jgi:hypothetical protein
LLLKTDRRQHCHLDGNDHLLLSLWRISLKEQNRQWGENMCFQAWIWYLLRQHWIVTVTSGKVLGPKENFTKCSSYAFECYHYRKSSSFKKIVLLLLLSSLHKRNIWSPFILKNRSNLVWTERALGYESDTSLFQSNDSYVVLAFFLSLFL